MCHIWYSRLPLRLMCQIAGPEWMQRMSIKRQEVVGDLQNGCRKERILRMPGFGRLNPDLVVKIWYANVWSSRFGNSDWCAILVVHYKNAGAGRGSAEWMSQNAIFAPLIWCAIARKYQMQCVHVWWVWLVGRNRSSKCVTGRRGP